MTWYYHAEETKNGRHSLEPKGGLYLSDHGDENDVQTISHRCDVLSFARYAKRVKQLGLSFSELENSQLDDRDDLYYFGGYYKALEKITTYMRDNPAVTGADKDKMNVVDEEKEDSEEEQEDEGEKTKDGSGVGMTKHEPCDNQSSEG